MAIHELALLVSFFDVTVENIAECIPDKAFSSCQTLTGPSGKEFTDFDKIKFTIKTKTGKEVSVQADRCGGNTSYAKVDKDGVEVFRHEMPDEEDMANVAALEKEYPGAMVRKLIRWIYSGRFPLTPLPRDVSPAAVLLCPRPRLHRPEGTRGQLLRQWSRGNRSRRHQHRC